MKDDELYQMQAEKRRQEFTEQLVQVHSQNLINHNKKREATKKLEFDIDRMARDNGIKMADNNIMRRKNEILQQQRKNQASE